MIALYKHYDKKYSKYETSFPPAFPWNRGTGEDVPRYVMGEDGYWYNPQAKESGKALLSCIGDLMCEPRMTRANRYGDSYFFHPLFQYVRGILKGSDFSVGNLETTLTDCTPYAGEYHRIAGKYHCNGPECYLDALRYAGFDALVNANNHNCDSGLIGLQDTNDSLDKYQFMHTGTYCPEDEERVLFVKINGIRVAVLSYGNRYNDLDNWHLTQEGRDVYLNWFTKEKCMREVAYAREKGAEFVMCYVHWGKDYYMEPNEQQVQVLSEMKDTGVDYIVGSHTHCLQAHNIAVAEDGKEIPMMFSMGNFVTNEVKELCKHTGILQLMLRREAGKITVQEYFIPCYVFDEMGTGRFCVVPADGLLNGGIGGEKMQQIREYVRDRIGPDLAELPTGVINLAQLCDAMGVALPAEMKDRPVVKLTVQPRLACPGALYFSTGKETRFDMLDLPVWNLAGVVTETPIEGLPCIIVPDVKKAYLAACVAAKQRVHDAKIVLVAGPSGKTVTREMIGDVLEGNGGVLTIKDGEFVDMAPWQNLHPYHEYCVQELRADDPMGIEVAAKAVAPHICVVTGMMEGLADLVAGIQKGGVLFINGNDAALTDAVKALDTTGITVKVYGEETLDCPGLPLPEMKSCAAAAYAVGCEAGMEEKTVRELIAKYTVSGYTQNVMAVDDITLILNTNCKSEDSAQSALQEMAKKEGRKLAILGDLDGETTQKVQEDVAKAAVQMGVEGLFCMGTHAEAACAASGAKKAVAAADEHALEMAVLESLQPGDVLLVNGGRVMQFCVTLRRLFGLTDGYISGAT